MLRGAIIVLVALLLAACATQQRLQDPLCERTINLYARHIDLGEPARVAELFTENATWQLGSTRLQGRTEIRNYFAALSDDTTRVSRHSQTNTTIDWQSDSEAVGTVYLTLYRGVRTGEAFASTVGQPLFVGHYDDRYQVVDGRCLISRRMVVPAFVVQ